MHLLTFMSKKFALGLSMLVATLFLGFLMMSALTENVAFSLLGATASPEQLAAKNAELGLDRNVLVRFVDWAGSALSGDLGTAWFTPASVSTLLATKVPVTLSLVVGTLAVSLVVSLCLGLVAGMRRGIWDRVVQIMTIVGFIIPPFLLALVLVLVIAVQARLLPATGYIDLARDPGLWLRSLVLPVASLSLGGIAAVTQQVRRAVIDVADREYVRTLRARGLSEARVVCLHIVKSASGIGVQVLALQAIGLLGGAVIAEQIFAMPGIGAAAVQYTPQGDVPIVMGILLVLATLVFVINLAADLLVALLNPKVTTA